MTEETQPTDPVYKTIEIPDPANDHDENIHQNVISLSQARLEKETHNHTSGEAQCMECKHRWAFVAEWPFHHLECPECGIYKGRPIFPYGPSIGDVHVLCSLCSNEHFKLFLRDSQTHVVCENCGNNVTDAFF